MVVGASEVGTCSLVDDCECITKGGSRGERGRVRGGVRGGTRGGGGRRNRYGRRAENVHVPRYVIPVPPTVGHAHSFSSGTHPRESPEGIRMKRIRGVFAQWGQSTRRGRRRSEALFEDHNRRSFSRPAFVASPDGSKGVIKVDVLREWEDRGQSVG